MSNPTRFVRLTVKHAREYGPDGVVWVNVRDIQIISERDNWQDKGKTTQLVMDGEVLQVAETVDEVLGLIAEAEGVKSMPLLPPPHLLAYARCILRDNGAAGVADWLERVAG